MNQEEKDSLNAIRFKIVNDQTDFNKQEVLHLQVVYTYITKYAGKERVLNLSCQSCLITAMNITKNYIKYHEDIDVQLKNVVKVKRFELVGDGEITGISFTDKPIKGMEWHAFSDDKTPTLKELREKYPNIKSNSVKGFLKKLEDGRGEV